MAYIHLHLLSEEEIQSIHSASLKILRDTGIRIHHEAILKLLGDQGASIDRDRQIARISESMVMESVKKASKKYVLYGRDPQRTARFGFGDLNLISSPGQYGWIDRNTHEHRQALIEDARQAIRLGDALPNITIVGSMGQPREIDERYRDVFLTAELLKGSTKPTRTWVHNGPTARYVLEIYRTIAGGDQALRERPMTETFLEPISPLQMPRDGLDAVIEYARAGQPVSIGPMSMTSGTAPGTIAGTLAQENAEILAGIVITQALNPGTPILYGGIPHIMDMRTTICSFGSPEQALMGIAMVEMGRFYGFPVYINVGLTDSKLLDAQAGAEKGMTLALGVLAGGEMFGHAGICGTDHGASLEWLAADDEIMAYVKRLTRGFQITEDTLAANVIKEVGPGGNYLAESHTRAHFRKELWFPGLAWTRQSYAAWAENGKLSMADRLHQKVDDILKHHVVAPLDDSLLKEIERIAACAQKELTR